MRIRTIRDIGNAIRGRRHALGWSQADLASRAGLSRKWVSEAERGHTVVGIRSLLAVFEALDVAIELRMPGDVTGPRRARHDDDPDLDEILEAHRGA
jgi:HTH-type transcriptional regulator / antitoxin HipB